MGHLPTIENGEASQLMRTENIRLDVFSAANCWDTSAQNWFAVYTTCRHEKRIAQHLAQREIQHYLPLYRSDRKWRDGSKVTLELPLFPSYIFVRIRRSERSSVLSVPGALALVGGTGGEPALLPDSAVDALRAGLQEHNIEPHPLLRIGQRVRIRCGAFKGMEGVVIRRKGGCRVVLTLEQIMRSVAVEVDESDVECVTAERPITGCVLDADRRLGWQKAS
jgi:transcription antitermination factor NusG